MPDGVSANRWGTSSGNLNLIKIANDRVGAWELAN
jgi:hypothetical protein